MASKVVSVTTDADGDGSVELRLYGSLVALGVRQGTLADDFDVTVTDEIPEIEILAVTGLTANGTYLPRAAVQDGDGVDIPDAFDKPAITGLLKITVASGGNVKTGEFVVITQ